MGDSDQEEANFWAAEWGRDKLLRKQRNGVVDEETIRKLRQPDEVIPWSTLPRLRWEQTGAGRIPFLPEGLDLANASLGFLAFSLYRQQVKTPEALDFSLDVVKGVGGIVAQLLSYWKSGKPYHVRFYWCVLKYVWLL